MAEQEPDITNFSTSSSHRLPTVSATQALQFAGQRRKRTATGISNLDSILRADNGVVEIGGIPRGQVTEIYGPPGVGKTALALQIAVNAVHSYDAQSHVVWVNTGSAVPPQRVKDFINGYRMPTGEEPSSSPPRPRSKAEVLEKFDCIDALTLPRLITLFLHPTTMFPPAQATLIVVDDLSNTIHGSFPKNKGRAANTTSNGVREKQAQKAAGRKWAVLADLAAAISRMAVVRNVAILVVNQTATSLSRGEKARLKPALTSPQWTLAVQNRILLYRDFLSSENAEDLPVPIVHQMRFAEVTKMGGKECDYGHRPTSFVIRKGGIREVQLKAKSLIEISPAKPQPELNGPTKRKADEIADSENEGDEAGSDDDLGLAVEDDDSDSDVEILGDNKIRPPVVTASQQLVYENGLLENGNDHREQTGPALPVRASPMKPTPSQLLKGSEDYLTQVDEEDEESLASSGEEPDPSPLE